MQAIDALLTRRSARTLTEPAPDAGALELIFASAVRAPDHGRLRPWRFVVMRAAARARFGKLLAAHLGRAHPHSDQEALRRERLKALRAPLIVAVAARCNPAVKIPVIEQVLSQILACGAKAVRLQKALIRDWEELSTSAAVARGIDVFAEAYATDEPRQMAKARLAAMQARRAEPD